MITTIVNVVSTPISFYTVEKFGRRPLLIWGGLGMVVCQFIAASIGVAKPTDNSAIAAEVAFLCIFIFFFASTWGPGAWYVVGLDNSQTLVHKLIIDLQGRHWRDLSSSNPLAWRWSLYSL